MKWVPESVQWQREEWSYVTKYEGERAGKEGERTLWFRDKVNPHILDNIKVGGVQTASDVLLNNKSIHVKN